MKDTKIKLKVKLYFKIGRALLEEGRFMYHSSGWIRSKLHKNYTKLWLKKNTNLRQLASQISWDRPNQDVMVPFSVADTQLYKRLCPSAGPSLCPLIRRSICFSVDTSRKVRKWAYYVVGFCVCVGDMGYGWGLDAPAHPSATILWPRVTCLG